MTEAARAPSTGTAALDDLIDGVRVGDNLVVIADDPAVLGHVANAFLAAPGPGPAVLVDAGGTATADAPTASVLVLDHRASDGTVEKLTWDVGETDEQVGSGARFLFDSLTAVHQRMGADAALELFLAVCPRLYRRGSVAMWLLDAAAHDQSFLDRVGAITQVVVRLHGSPDDVQAEVVVAAGRPATTRGRRLRLAVADGRLRATENVRRSHDRLGELVRTQRLLRGMSQTELARRTGVSPSAISQVERGVRGIGGETLMHIWESLGVPFGPDDTLQRGYRIGRRSAHESTDLADGVTGYLVADDVTVGQCWRITFAPGVRGGGPLFAGRVRESLVIDRGVLALGIGGHHEVLHEGDSLMAPRAPIEMWHNPGPEPAAATWWVFA